MGVVSAGRFRVVLSLLALLAAGGCAGGAAQLPPAGPGEIAALARDIRALGPEVDAEEAARAARVAVRYSRQLARAYRVSDPPIIHNTKVNLLMRPRGLCWHWAADLEERLAEEAFGTLNLHRAIATPDTPFGGDHSALVVSRRGGTVAEGLVLDPWRGGGVLHWAPARADAGYDWRSRARVMDEKRLRRARARVRER